MAGAIAFLPRRLRQFVAVLLVVLGSSLLSPYATADYSTSKAQFLSLGDKERFELQITLVWSGYYNRIIDGQFGRGTYEAIVQFQSANGYLPTGVLDRRQAGVLLSQASAFSSKIGFEIVTDVATGLSFGLPARLLESVGTTKYGTRWFRHDGSLEIETIRVPYSDASYDQLYQRLASNTSTRRVIYRIDRGIFFVATGYSGGKKFYTRFVRGDRATVGFAVSWNASAWSELDRVVVAMSSVTNLGSSAVDTAESPPDEEGGKAQKPTEPSSWSGTGFFVTASGTIATNAHVVDNCSNLVVQNYGSASVVRSDSVNDIAFIRLQTFGGGATFARFRDDAPQLGEKIIAVGFPLSEILAGSLNVTDGIISSLSGLKGDTRHIQFTAPIQNGNSGGPLLDVSGLVVGIVTSKLSDLFVLNEQGTLPQGVNFAVRGGLLINLADVAHIEVARAGTVEPLAISDIATLAEKFTVQIICRGVNGRRSGWQRSGSLNSRPFARVFYGCGKPCHSLSDPTGRWMMIGRPRRQAAAGLLD